MFYQVRPGLISGRGALDASFAVGPTTIFTPIGGLNTQDGGFAGGSVRSRLTITSGSLGRVRATFQAGASGGLVAAHCSIGVFGGGFTQTTATPVELLFGGASGFSIAAGASITSDYVTLAFTSADQLVAIIDETSGFIANNNGTATNALMEYGLSPKATYNVAVPAAMNGNNPSWCGAVLSVETSV